MVLVFILFSYIDTCKAISITTWDTPLVHTDLLFSITVPSPTIKPIKYKIQIQNKIIIIVEISSWKGHSSRAILLVTDCMFLQTTVANTSLMLSFKCFGTTTNSIFSTKCLFVLDYCSLSKFGTCLLATTATFCYYCYHCNLLPPLLPITITATAATYCNHCYLLIPLPTYCYHCNCCYLLLPLQLLLPTVTTATTSV